MDYETDAPAAANSDPPRVAALLAELPGPDALIAAAKTMREQGYTELDAHTPFPLHGIDEALGIQRTYLPWIVLIAGVSGGLGLLGFILWANGIDYAFVVSGKPDFSFPAFIPPVFEASILLAAFGALFGMIIMNGLLKYSNPLFDSQRFRGVTTDRFFLVVDPDDELFDVDRTTDALRAAGATHVELLHHPDEKAFEIPVYVHYVGAFALLVATIPPLLVARARGTTGESPRVHLIDDMDDQAHVRAQENAPFPELFPHNYAALGRVDGTVRWEEAALSEAEMLLAERRRRGQRLRERFAFVSADGEAIPAPPEPDGREGTSEPAREPEPDETAGSGSESAASQPSENGEAAAGMPPAEPGYPVDEIMEFPSELTAGAEEEIQTAIRRGQTMYRVYCSVCHGLDGAGRGPAALRSQALALSQGSPAWSVTSLHQASTLRRPVGHLYGTISHGRGKMPGYAAQIRPEDRWKIVMYIRALQRSRLAPSGVGADEANSASSQPPAEDTNPGEEN